MEEKATFVFGFLQRNAQVSRIAGKDVIQTQVGGLGVRERCDVAVSCTAPWWVVLAFITAFKGGFTDAFEHCRSSRGESKAGCFEAAGPFKVWYVLNYEP